MECAADAFFRKKRQRGSQLTQTHTQNKSNAAWDIAVGRHRVESRFVTYISFLLLMPQCHIGTSHSADVSPTWSSAHTPSRTLIVCLLILSHHFFFFVLRFLYGDCGLQLSYWLNETAEDFAKSKKKKKKVTNSQRLLFQKYSCNIDVIFWC